MLWAATGGLGPVSEATDGVEEVSAGRRLRRRCLGVPVGGVRAGRVAVAVVAVTLVFGGASVAAESAPPPPVLTVTPSTDLVNGQGVQVTGAGLLPNETGAILECNDAPGQPTVAYQDFAVDVGCSDIFGEGIFVFFTPIVTTSADGTFSSPFVVRTGVVGPPVEGIDSAGHDSAADAAAYPCPPTSAQAAAGDTCNLTFGDLGGDVARHDITFGPPPTRPPTARVVFGSPSLAPPPEATGVSVEIAAFGLAPDSPTLVAECNLTPGEPPGSFPGLPVACAQPVVASAPPYFPTTGNDGSLSVSMQLLEGNLGSAGLSAPYPCPPTRANLAAGGACAVVVEDAGGNVATALLALTGPLPVPAMSASPATGLLNGQEVEVAGSGFAADSGGYVLECDGAPGEPTVPFDGASVPVGCSSPFNYGSWAFDPGSGFTDQNGDLLGSVTVRTGPLGPPVDATDSAGGDAAADAARYPCPPTPAEIARGAGCELLFLDGAGDLAAAPVSFGHPRTFAPVVQVLAKYGTVDVAAVPVGTSLVVTGSDFTPRSLFVVLECPVTAGTVSDPVSHLPLSCQEIDQTGPTLTDEAGGVTSVVQIRSLIDYFAAAPGDSPCTAGGPQVRGTCEIVVRDGAGDQAETAIGVVPGAAPPPVYAGKPMPTTAP